MTDSPASESGVERRTKNMDDAVVQIRDVVKWLIGAFAAVAVVLAAGSQLGEVGSLSDGRLLAAFGGVLATLLGIALAIYFAAKVLTPSALTLKQMVREEKKSPAGKAIAKDSGLLLGHGTSIKEFEQRRNAAVTAEADAWTKFEADEGSSSLEALAVKASKNRERIDEAMVWLISFGRFKETSQLFKAALRAMFAAAAIAALGITGFAWAAHPEEKKEGNGGALVAKAPSAVTIDLSREGRETVGEEIGRKCDPEAVAAVAVAGEPRALEVVTTPSKRCKLARFMLTPAVGAYQARATVPTRPNPTPPTGAG